MKVALVYDRVNKWGGAERILLALHELFPDAPLYTSVYNSKTAGWAQDFVIKTSFLQHIPYASSAHEYYPMFMPIAFENFSFDAYDLVISVSSEAGKGIITGKQTLHICYCLTPTRYLWSGYEEYFTTPFFRFLTKPIVWYLRLWDTIAANRPDHFIAISEEIKKRIKTYYNKDAFVVYPPVSLGEPFGLAQGKKGEGYFLVVSRLVPYKRIDIAIKACNQLELPLKIVGVGSEEKRLKKIAGPTIEFLGLLTQESLIAYYKGARALLFPGIEDFGMTVLEAQAFGRPVIAFKGGGALETVMPGKTGVFFAPQTVDALTAVLASFDERRFNSEDCIKNVKKFSQNQFKETFIKTITKLLKERENYI